MKKNNKLIIYTCVAIFVIVIGGFVFYNNINNDGFEEFEGLEEAEGFEGIGGSESGDGAGGSDELRNGDSSGGSMRQEGSDRPGGIISNSIENKVEEENIVVHVIGHVMNEGIVKIKDGSRVIDAITAAGGATEDSDLSLINLAYVLSDGEKIYVPGIEDDLENDVSVFSGANSNGKKELKVNVNTANETEFEKLPGIGPSIASKIVAYRNENGKFKSIEELKNISGIGESKFNNIKNYLVIK